MDPVSFVILIGFLIVIFRVLTNGFVQGLLMFWGVYWLWDDLEWYWILLLVVVGIGAIHQAYKRQEP